MSLAGSSWPELSADEQQELLRLARVALDRFLIHHEVVVEPPAGTPVPPRLRCMQGAFVSLHRGRELRGCVGFPEPSRPLVEAVMENAIGAAGRDPRFPPVEPAELPDIAIEVSALGVMGLLQPAEVEAGHHGLMVEYQGRRGLLLPQVAVEHHWTRTDLLRQVCIKAGLADDIWQRPETRLYGFTAQVFTDSAWRVQTARLSSIQATPEERRS
jgi:AmmeMemoRadiSam system protein A